MTSQDFSSVRKEVFSMFARRLSQQEENERAREATRLPREKPLTNLDETDSDRKAIEAYTNSVSLEVPPLNPKLFGHARAWANRMKRQSGDGRVGVGSVSTIELGGETCLLLIAPSDCNPLACCELGVLQGMPVQVVSDSCPLAQALLGTPVTQNCRSEVESIEGRGKTKRVFEGRVLAVC